MTKTPRLTEYQAEALSIIEDGGPNGCAFASVKRETGRIRGYADTIFQLRDKGLVTISGDARCPIATAVKR